MRSIYYILCILCIPLALANTYCYPLDIRAISNVTSPCYLNDTSICVDSPDVVNDFVCQVNYIQYVDRLSVKQLDMLGIVSRNLTNITTDIFFKIEQGTKVKYIDRDVPYEVIKEVPLYIEKNITQYIEVPLILSKNYDYKSFYLWATSFGAFAALFSMCTGAFIYLKFHKKPEVLP